MPRAVEQPVAIEATLYEPPSIDGRELKRRPVETHSAIGLTDGKPRIVLVHDLSCDGLRLETAFDLTVGTNVSISLPNIGTRIVRIVRRDGDRYGCRFTEPVHPTLLSRAFVAPVAAGQTAIALPVTFPEPDVRKWHPAVRVGLMLGLGVAAWALIMHYLAA